MKRLFHFSDSHGYHSLLNIPENIDIVVFSGDESNYYDVYKNEHECLNFLHWFGNLPIKHKIMIAGNHSSYIFNATTKFKEWCKHYNIIYLENEGIEIEGIKFWGSPNTPTFGDWYFMKSRDKMDKLWSHVPEDTDVFIGHGPPKGILDLSYNRNNQLEFCGDKALRNHILNRIKPKYYLFGHIHNCQDIVNAGITKLSAYDTIFSNGSIVTDGKFGVLSSQGNIFELD